MQDAAPPSDPLKIPTVNELTDEAIDALLERVREQRLKPVQVYEQMLHMKSEAKKLKLEEDLEHQLQMFEKEMNRADAAIAKLEGRSRRAIRMEIELA
jgi:hypothetical protein